VTSTGRAGLVIAVDGPSGSGKSSAARGAARALGLRYLDSGAMYRAVTLWMLRHGVDVADPAAVADRVQQPAIEVGTDPDEPGGPAVFLDGAVVTAEIRDRAVSNAVSAVSAVPEVRARLVAMQRSIIAGAIDAGREPADDSGADRGAGKRSGIVVEGRDIGTVVAPDAQVKVFLTASEATRAERRTRDLAADPAATLTVTQQEMGRRDRLDSTRAASPLLKAGDAVEIDSTRLGLDEVIAQIVALAQRRAVSA
jgi:CMP/dCMP kinase